MLPFNREVTMAALTSVLMMERRSCNYEISSRYWDQAVLNDQPGTLNFINWKEVFRTLPNELAFDNKDQHVSFQYPLTEEEALFVLLCNGALSSSDLTRQPA